MTFEEWYDSKWKSNYGLPDQVVTNIKLALEAAWDEGKVEGYKEGYAKAVAGLCLG